MLERSTILEVQELFRQNKTLEKGALAAWDEVNLDIIDRATKRKPAPRNFEVHHEQTVAREAFLKSIADGNTPSQAATIARARIKLIVPQAYSEA